MQRINNMEKWTHVPVGKSISLDGAAGRRVRLDVNAPGEALLWYSDGDGKLTFLAIVKGRDVIEFIAADQCSITADSCDVWCHTFDGEVLAVENADAVKLTKMVTRRPRNHEMELMAYEMRRNSEQMYASIYDQLRREFVGRSAATPAAAVQPEPARDASGAGKQPEPDAASSDGAGDESADGGSGKSPAKKGG